jgi:hypothetical protein
MLPRADRPEYEALVVCPTLEGGRPGAFHTALAQVIAFEGDREVARADAEIQVRDDPAEFRDPRPDPVKLAALAEGSGGIVVRDAHSLAALFKNAKRNPRVTIVTREPIWDQPVVWAIIVGLLSVEWIVRRRRGLA